MIHTNHTVRKNNEAFILQTIINNIEISRADLSKLTGLNKPSVSDIIKNLLHNHIINETRLGASSNTGGRKPILISFNAKVASCIAINIDRDTIEFNLRYIDGTLIHSLIYDYDDFISLIEDFNSPKLINFLQFNIDTLLSIDTDSFYGTKGISIAVHGIVKNDKIMFTPNYKLDELDLFSELSSIYDIPIYINNEANLSALGEYTYSSYSESLISISIHSGIGAGVISNGNMLVGKKGSIGEIGHAIIYPNGKKCPCGNFGCLEQYISKKVIYDTLQEHFNKKINLSDIIKYWNQKDPFVKEFITKYVTLLSIQINNILCTLDPATIVINGNLFFNISDLLPLLHKNLSNNLYTNANIKLSTLKNDAILLGCVAQMARHFLKVEHLKLTNIFNANSAYLKA